MDGPRRQIEMVRILEEYPGLGSDLPPGARYPASAAAIAPVRSFAAGTRMFYRDGLPPRGHLGLLVLDGLIAVHVSFGEIGAIEFLGPCDVLAMGRVRNVAMADAHWETLTSVRMAELDRDFATRVRPWPELATALLDRYSERLASQLLYAGTRQVRRVEDRVHIALWHFALRWGQISRRRPHRRAPPHHWRAAREHSRRAATVSQHCARGAHEPRHHPATCRRQLADSGTAVSRYRTLTTTCPRAAWRGRFAGAEYGCGERG